MEKVHTMNIKGVVYPIEDTEATAKNLEQDTRLTELEKQITVSGKEVTGDNTIQVTQTETEQQLHVITTDTLQSKGKEIPSQSGVLNAIEQNLQVLSGRVNLLKRDDFLHVLSLSFKVNVPEGYSLLGLLNTPLCTFTDTSGVTGYSDWAATFGIQTSGSTVYLNLSNFRGVTIRVESIEIQYTALFKKI